MQDSRCPPKYHARHILTTTDRAWILCTNIVGGDGVIVEWDGFSQSYNGIHNVYTYETVSGVNYKETPIVVNSNGTFLEFDGRGFVPMIRNGQVVSFPIAEEVGNALASGAGTSISEHISPRGMTVSEDGLIYINIRQPNNNSFKQGAGVC